MSTIAYTTFRGAVFGTTHEEIMAAIKEQYPDVYDVEMYGIDNQRLDWEMVYGMAEAGSAFADSYYA